jgi:D-cysteine desulfhydrase
LLSPAALRVIWKNLRSRWRLPYMPNNPDGLPDLARNLSKFLRLKLADYPTPLEPLKRLSQELGNPLWIKRDDLIGPAPGGNKCRKLEFILADAQASGAVRLATFGGIQSNHARMTAAAGRRLGLETHIFCFESRPRRMAGNMLLNELYGAEVHFLPIGGGNGGLRIETANRLVRWLARIWAGPNYFIPAGGHTWKGCLGYAAAGLEIDEQARDLGIGDAWLVLAAGTGGTLAGLIAGLALCGSGLRPLGIDVGKLWQSFPQSIASLAEEICTHLGSPRRFQDEDVPLIERTYTGERYGVPSDPGNSALHRLARTEGILLDPVYTAKAFGGLLDLLTRGELGNQKPVIFLHTGGLPGIYGFSASLLGLQ